MQDKHETVGKLSNIYAEVANDTVPAYIECSDI